MSVATFRQFVEQEKAVATKKKSVDWNKKKLAYLEQLDRLFENVEVFLREFIESGAVRIERNVITIDEEYVGKYDAPVLRIHIYGRHADLLPMGVNIIGTPGRVGLKGIMGTVRFVLADKREKSPQVFASMSWLPEDKEHAQEKAEEWANRKRDYVWKIITDPPQIRFVELNEDSFLSSLMEVLNG